MRVGNYTESEVVHAGTWDSRPFGSQTQSWEFTLQTVVPVLKSPPKPTSSGHGVILHPGPSGYKTPTREAVGTPSYFVQVATTSWVAQ